MNKLLEQFEEHKNTLNILSKITSNKETKKQRYLEAHEDSFIQSQEYAIYSSINEEELASLMLGEELFTDIIVPLMSVLIYIEQYNNFVEEKLCDGEGYAPLPAYDAYDLIVKNNLYDTLRDYEVLALYSAAIANDYHNFEKEYNKLEPQIIAKPLAEIKESIDLDSIQDELYSTTTSVDDMNDSMNGIYRFFLNKSEKDINIHKKNFPWTTSVIELVQEFPNRIKKLQSHQETIPLHACKRCLHDLLSEYDRIKESLSNIEIETIEEILSRHDDIKIISEIRSNAHATVKLTLPETFFNTHNFISHSLYLCKLPKKRQNAGLADLINWLADEKGWIHKDLLTRKSLAFILSGNGDEGQTINPIKWDGEPSLILCLCKCLYGEDGDVPDGTYDKAKSLFDCGDAQMKFTALKPTYADHTRNSESRELFEFIESTFNSYNKNTSNIF